MIIQEEKWGGGDLSSRTNLKVRIETSFCGSCGRETGYADAGDIPPNIIERRSSQKTVKATIDRYIVETMTREPI